MAAACGAPSRPPESAHGFAVSPSDPPRALGDESCGELCAPPESAEEAAPDRAGDVSGCPALFDEDARDQWHAVSGQQYYVDRAGRPAAARATFPPLLADDVRDTACQGVVGRWGDAADPGNDYDGGHLIGYQLGGWGARANLVPQQASFNRGNWAQVENAIAECDELEEGQLELRVDAIYDDADTLVPRTMSMTLHDAGSGASIVLTFANVARGGADGALTRGQGVAWLASIGCL